jgi:spore germination protein KC
MRKIVVVCLICLTMLAGTGCWDLRDINNRAYVTTMGLDMPENGARSGYRVTFVIINPSGVKQQSRAESTIVQTVEAESFRKAMEQLQSSISRTVTLSHLRVLVIGEDMARRNFYDLGNFVEKNPQVAMRLRLMFVQEGKAQEVLQSKPRFEKSITTELVAMTQLERDFSLTRTNFFYHFIRDLRSTGGEAFGSRVITSPSGAIALREGGGCI